MTFDASDSYDPDGTIEKYVWDFGDGHTRSTTNPKITHTYDEAGTYTVELVVYDDQGAESEPYTKSITIAPPEKPTACFSASPTRGTAPLRVKFSNCSTGEIDSYHWDFGDGGTSTSREPTHTYQKPGKYTVSLTVRGPGGEDTETKRDYITVTSPIPEAPSNLEARAISSSEIELTWRDNSDNEEGFKLERRKGRTGSWREIKRVGRNTTTYTDSGLEPETEYCYRVRAYNAQGDSDYSNVDCATTKKPPVPPPVADFTAEPTSGPAPLTVKFTDKSTGEIDSWSWDFGDGGKSTEKNPTHTYQRPGRYTVKLTVTGPGGSDTETKRDYITVTPPAHEFQATAQQGQLARIEIPQDIRSQLPEIARFVEKPHTTLGGRRSDSLADVGLRLNPSTGLIFGKPTKTGSFNFLVAVQDPSTGEEVAYIWALVTITPPPVTNQPPVADPNGPYQGRVGEEITFDGSKSYDPDGQIVGYTWDFGDGATGTGVKATHAYSAEGTYNVCLTVTDDKGATDKKCTTAEITKPKPPPTPTGKQPPVAKFTFSPAQPEPGVAVNFDARESYDPDGGNIILYEWDFGDGSAKNYGAIVTHIFMTAGIYQVTLTVTDDDNQTSSTTQQVCVGMPCPTVQEIKLSPGEPEPGRVETKGLAKTQYTIEVLEGTKLLMVRLQGHGTGDLNLYVRYGQTVETQDGAIQADFASATPWPLESLTITDPQPGTYYIAVENLSDSPQEFTILAATVPVLELLSSGAALEGEIAAAAVGGSRLGLIQYVIEVPEGGSRLQVVLENLGVGRLNLHLRYGEPVEAHDGRILADYSSTSGLGREQLTLLGPQLKPGKYYIAVENLEPYPQRFRLTATVTVTQGQGVE